MRYDLHVTTRRSSVVTDCITKIDWFNVFVFVSLW